MKIVFLIEKVGPYHAYRLEQLMDYMDVVCVETRPSSERYAWKESQKDTIAKKIHPFTGNTVEQLSELLSRLQPQVLFVGGYGFKEMIWAMCWGVQKAIPMVMLSDSTQIDEPRHFAKEWIKKMIIANCDAAFVAGTSSKAYMQALGMASNAIFTPYDIVDNDFYAERIELTSLHDRPYLVCVSRLLPQKNLFFLVDVFAELAPKYSIDLLILGNGELEVPLRKYISEKGLNQRIFLKGFLHREVVRQYYHHAQALILASTSEPWGLCVNEAMAAGLPVLVSNYCGAAIDLVEEGKNGYTFSPVDAQQATNVLDSFLKLDILQQKEMGKHSQKIIESYHGKVYWKAINRIVSFIQHKGKKTFYFRNIRIWFLIVISKRIN